MKQIAAVLKPALLEKMKTEMSASMETDKVTIEGLHIALRVEKLAI